MGYVRTTDGFVCLNKVVQQPITKLLCDRYLAAVCIDFTSQLNCSKSKRITNIILRSKTFWLSVLYPNLIQKKEDPYGKDLLQVHPQLTLNYVLRTRINRRVKKQNSLGYEISLEIIVPHRGSRIRAKALESNTLYQFLSNVEANLLISLDNHFLYLYDDGKYWDLLICLEHLAVGFRKNTLKDYKKQVGFNLSSLIELKLFRNRCYLSMQCLELLRQQLIKKKASLTIIDTLKKLHDFSWQTSLFTIVKDADNKREAVRQLVSCL